MPQTLQHPTHMWRMWVFVDCGILKKTAECMTLFWKMLKSRCIVLVFKFLLLLPVNFMLDLQVTWSENRIGVQIFPTFPDTRLRLLRNSCTFSVIFLVFWLPYGFAQFFLDLPQNLLPDILVAYTQFYVKVLKNFTYIQVMMNPVILFMLSYDFGTYCQRFKMKCPTLV